LSIEASKEVGELMGQKLNDLKISKAVFDRGGYIYHGRVKFLADGIREKGIEF
jgi:large subunit ribosomal protein L18